MNFYNASAENFSVVEKFSAEYWILNSCGLPEAAEKTPHFFVHKTKIQLQN
jgi:hypothetical protein